MHLKYISVKVGKNSVGCVRVLIEKHFRSPSRDSETHDTGKLFYFLVFGADEDENFMVCLRYFEQLGRQCEKVKEHKKFLFSRLCMLSRVQLMQ